MIRMQRVLLLAVGLAGGFLAAGPSQTAAKIHMDKETHLYHREICPDKALVKPRHLRLADSEEEARAKGFYPCEKCIAPNEQPSRVDRTGNKLSLPINREQTYVGQRSSKIYHYGWCPLVQELPDADRILFSSPKQAAQKDYQPCGECNPPALYQRLNPEFAPAPQTPEPAPAPPAPPAPNQPLPDDNPNPS